LHTNHTTNVVAPKNEEKSVRKKNHYNVKNNLKKTERGEQKREKSFASCTESYK